MKKILEFTTTEIEAHEGYLNLRQLNELNGEDESWDCISIPVEFATHFIRQMQCELRDYGKKTEGKEKRE